MIKVMGGKIVEQCNQGTGCTHINKSNHCSLFADTMAIWKFGGCPAFHIVPTKATNDTLFVNPIKHSKRNI